MSRTLSSAVFYEQAHTSTPSIIYMPPIPSITPRISRTPTVSTKRTGARSNTKTSTFTNTGSCKLDPNLKVTKTVDVNGDGTPDVIVSFTNKSGIVEAYVVFLKPNVCLSFDINNPHGVRVATNTTTISFTRSKLAMPTKVDKRTASSTPTKSIVATRAPSVTATITQVRMAVPVPIYSRPNIPLPPPAPPQALQAPSAYKPNVAANLANLGNATATGNSAGAAASCQLDKSISITDVGDVNGDGISDILLQVKLPSGEISVYVMFRKTNSCLSFDPAKIKPDGSNGYQIIGMPAGAILSFTGADVNGDRKSDVIIGDSTAASGLGQVYAIYGNTIFPPVIDLSKLGSYGFTLTGSTSVPGFGSSVSAIGDVNGDKVPDFSVTNVGNVNHPAQSTIVFGRNSTSSSASQGITNFSSSSSIDSISGATGYGIVGFSNSDPSALKVMKIGDFDGNGVQDIAISNPTASVNGMSNVGRVCIVLGGKANQEGVNLNNPNGINIFCINGKASGDLFGSSVSGLGDFSGDGIDDVIFGAPNASPNADLQQTGVAYILHGTKEVMPALFDLRNLNSKNGAELDGVSAGDLTGTTVAGIGDVNGDGYADAGVGAPGAQGNGLRGAGAVYIWYGGPGVPARSSASSLVGSAGMIVQGTSVGQGLGSTLATVGDASSRDVLLGNADGSTNYIYGQAGTALPDSSRGNGMDLSSLLGIIFAALGLLPVIGGLVYGAIAGCRSYKVKLEKDIKKGTEKAKSASIRANSEADKAQTYAQRAGRKTADATKHAELARRTVAHTAATAVADIEAETAESRSAEAVTESRIASDAATKARIAADKAFQEAENADTAAQSAQRATKGNIIGEVLVQREARRKIKHAAAEAERAEEEAKEAAAMAKEAAGEVNAAQSDAIEARRAAQRSVPQPITMLLPVTFGATPTFLPSTVFHTGGGAGALPLTASPPSSPASTRSICAPYGQTRAAPILTRQLSASTSPERFGVSEGPVATRALGGPFSRRALPAARGGVRDWAHEVSEGEELSSRSADHSEDSGTTAVGSSMFGGGLPTSHRRQYRHSDIGHGLSAYKQESGHGGYNMKSMNWILGARFAGRGVDVRKAVMLIEKDATSIQHRMITMPMHDISILPIIYELLPGRLHWATAVAFGGYVVFLDSENSRIPLVVSDFIEQTWPGYLTIQYAVSEQIYSDNCAHESVENPFALIFGTRVAQEYAAGFHRNLGSGSPRLLYSVEEVSEPDYAVVPSQAAFYMDKDDLWNFEAEYQVWYEINLAIHRTNLLIRAGNLALDAIEFKQCPNSETAKDMMVGSLYLYSAYSGAITPYLAAHVVSIGYTYYVAEDHTTGVQATAMHTAVVVGSVASYMALYAALVAVSPPLAFGFQVSTMALSAYQVASRIYNAVADDSNEHFYTAAEECGPVSLAGNTSNGIWNQ